MYSALGAANEQVYTAPISRCLSEVLQNGYNCHSLQLPQKR